jgi:hypothetical protein
MEGAGITSVKVDGSVMVAGESMRDGEKSEGVDSDDVRVSELCVKTL